MQFGKILFFALWIQIFFVSAQVLVLQNNRAIQGQIIFQDKKFVVVMTSQEIYVFSRLEIKQINENKMQLVFPSTGNTPFSKPSSKKKLPLTDSEINVSRELQKLLSAIQQDKITSAEEASEKLIQAKDKSVPAIGNELAKENEKIEQWLILILGKIDTSLAREELYKYVNSRQSKANIAAIYALAPYPRITYPRDKFVLLLLNLLKIPKSGLESAILHTLGNLQNPSAISDLTRFLSSSNPCFCIQAEHALKKICRTPQAKEIIGKHFLKLLLENNGAKAELKKIWIGLLGESGYEESVPNLKAFLATPSLWEATILALAQIKTEEAQKILLDQLKKVSDVEKKIKIISCFADFPLQERSQWMISLISLLESNNKKIRNAAWKSLKQSSKLDFCYNSIAWKAWWEERQKFIQEQREVAVSILHSIGWDEQIASLKKMAKNKNPEIRFAALKILSQYPASMALEDFHDALEKEKEIAIKIQIICVLGAYCSQKSLFFLEKELQNNTAAIQASVAYNLGNFREKHFVPLLVDLLQSKENIVCFSAHHSLVLITKKNWKPVFEQWEKIKKNSN
jgi:HEAT repeat protein